MAKNVVAELKAVVRADTKGLRSDFARGRQETRGFFSSLQRTATAAGVAVLAAFSARAVLRVTRNLVNLAAEAAESENLFEQSMEGMADATRRWSDDTARALGLNAFEVRKNAATLFLMIKNMGVAEDQAQAMAQSLTGLTFDMASFRNLRFEDAFQKIAAGITGESEPLKRLGIVLNETMVKQEAYTTGIARANAKLTEGQKVLARYSLLMRLTSKDQGDLARTADSASNQQKRLQAQWRQNQIELGQKLLPAYNQLLQSANAIASDPAFQEWLVEVAAGIGSMAEGVASLTTKLERMGDVLEILEGPGTKFIRAFGGRQETRASGFGFAGGPFGAIEEEMSRRSGMGMGDLRRMEGRPSGGFGGLRNLERGIGGQAAPETEDLAKRMKQRMGLVAASAVPGLGGGISVGGALARGGSALSATMFTPTRPASEELQKRQLTVLESVERNTSPAGQTQVM